MRNKFQALTKFEKADFLTKLSEDSYVHCRFFTDIMLRTNQIVVPGDWRYWLFIGGRGTGKSFTGAVEVRKRVYAKQQGLCIIAPTHQDLIKIMVPAIIKEFPDYHKPVYIGGDKQIIKCHNGITIDCRTSQQGEIRGPNYTFVWLDELVNCWDGIADKVERNFAILDASIRKGGAQILITTTGDRWPIFKKWYEMYGKKNPLIQIRSGTMKENEYLSPQAVQALYEKYGNSRYEDLELNGIINFDVEGALWTPALIERTRKASMETAANPPNPNNIRKYNNPYDFFIKFAIGGDPSTTSHSSSDAWGIVVVGLGRDLHLYVLEDYSRIMSPNDAANKIAELHNKYRNAQVVAESNQGGEMISYILRTKMPNLQPKLVHAHQNKMTRAQPIVVLWDQSRAHIVGNMPELEREMSEYTGDPSQKSPNRLDAMVHAAQFLLLEPNMRVPDKTWMPNFR
jgi:phage terminase large subunit-like protein